jgi:hypothetical protein
MKNHLLLLYILSAILCSCGRKDTVAPSTGISFPDKAHVYGSTNAGNFNMTDGIENTTAETGSFLSRNASDTSEAIYQFFINNANASFRLDFNHLRTYNLRMSDTSLDAVAQVIRPGVYPFLSEHPWQTASAVLLSYSDERGKIWASEFGPQTNSVFIITSVEKAIFHDGRALKAKIAFACTLYDGNGLSHPINGSAQVYFVPPVL